MENLLATCPKGLDLDKYYGDKCNQNKTPGSEIFMFVF